MRPLPLVHASAATIGLVILGVMVYPNVHTHYIYPETNTVTTLMSRVAKLDIDKRMASSNPGDKSIYHLKDSDLALYPQLKEGIEYIQADAENRDISSFDFIEEDCQFHAPTLTGCYPKIPFRMSEVSKVRNLLEMEGSGSDYIEHAGNYYSLSLGEPNLRPIYNNSLLLGITVSTVGSIIIWLVIAKIESDRRGQVEKSIDD
jgi:hypothetical protein